MHESERNRLKKLQMVLQLAASDMDQAEAAARALEAGSDDVALLRALETAMVVCYVRAFTKNSLGTLPKEYVPSSSPHAELHQTLWELRHRAYAHTDKASGRTASTTIIAVEGDVASVEWREQWMALVRDPIDPYISLFRERRERFRSDAASIQVQLDAE